MTHNEIVEAIKFLTPEAQWQLEGDDLANLVWLDETVSKPDDQVILDTVKNLPKLKGDAEKAKETAREALLNKLGITVDEAKLLLG